MTEQNRTVGLSSSSPEFADARAQSLYEEGARLLAGLWDDGVAMVRGGHHSEYHDPRATLAYAEVLLEQHDLARAERAIAAVLAIQELRPDDAHRGNFRWLFEDPCVTDLNAVEFLLDGLIDIMRGHGDALTAGLRAAISDAIALGLSQIDRLNVHLSYTNIALSDICNSVLGGQLIGDDGFVARGARRLDEWLAFTAASGAPHEFNSPTYLGVDLSRMAALVEGADDPAIALKARIAEEILWAHIASHYHPGLAQLAGPHSRSYFDGWTGAGGLLKLILWRLLGDGALRPGTPYAPRTREEGHAGIALATYHCPEYILEALREKAFPFESRETPDVRGGVDATTYMTDAYALGTASRDYGVGDPAERWPGFNSVLLQFRRDAEPGYGTLFARYIVNDKDALSPAPEDLWDEGQFVAAQHRNAAIVAYGLLPRIRPARSYKLSVKLLGYSPETQVWIDGARINALPVRIVPGARIVIAEGDVYIGLIPLEQTDMGSGAPIELRAEGYMLSLDIYNYLGPDKSFWEHRSQAGPFFRGNVRNAFAIEVALRAEYVSLEDFQRHIAAASITDATDGALEREITFTSGSVLTLRYSLRDMRLLERRIGGAPYTPPPARSGAVSGAGLQHAVSRGEEIELPGVTLDSGGAPAWLTADRERGSHVVVRVTEAAARLRLQTEATHIECDAFGFGRLQLDEAAGKLSIETASLPDGLRVSSKVELRTTLNGEPITPGPTAEQRRG